MSLQISYHNQCAFDVASYWTNKAILRKRQQALKLNPYTDITLTVK